MKVLTILLDIYIHDQLAVHVTGGAVATLCKNIQKQKQPVAVKKGAAK